MKKTRIGFVQQIIRYFPIVIIVALLPFMLTFDTLVYWLTRPSCLNCGSLGSFLQNNSLSFAMVSNYVGELGIGGYTFGKKKHG
jgi:hypothetical protein